MTRVGFVSAAVLALVFVVSASAAGPGVAWTARNMRVAVRGVGYPRPHPTKLACSGLGVAAADGRFASFRCVATYRLHRRSTFYIQGQGEGGWLCAGRRLAGCVVLRHGFITKASTASGLAAALDIAARGYMTNRYGSYQATGFCKQTSATVWACPFVEATVTLTLKAVSGGYVEAASTT